MSETALLSVFYSKILPNSVAGTVSILVILAFRQFTKRLPKGYVRTLWILLFVQLLTPPLFQGSFYTVRDLGSGIFGMNIGQPINNGLANKLVKMDSQSFANKNTAVFDSTDQSITSKHPSLFTNGQVEVPGNSDPFINGQTKTPDNSGQIADRQATAPNHSDRLTTNLPWIQNNLGQLSSIIPNASIRIWAVRLWLAGALVWAAYDCYLYLRLKKSIKHSYCTYKNGYWASDAANVPFVMPGLPPKIYLPAGMEPAQRENILAHERQHIHNLDPLLKCIAMLTVIIYWFHPLVWIAASLFGKDMEMYCDECVLRGKSMAQRKAYSNTLLEYASKSSGLTLTMNFAKSNTERRIYHILNVKKPHRTIRLLLAAFICICSFSFLSAKNVEGKAETANQTSKITSGQDKNIGKTQPSYQQDAHKFARRIVRLVKSGNKKALSKMIAYPILVHLNGEETQIIDAESFLENYNKIANKKWKTAVLDADIDGMLHNYMGFCLGNGEIWFSEQIGQEGYWIYAINNSGQNRFADSAQGTRDTWENLATSQGMTREEARRWYTRFAKEGLCETGLNFQFTGCIYDDFDKNGTNDVFVVSSLSPHEIYPESVTETMYVYGFINGEYVYGRGFRAFSQDGFKQFDVQASKQPGIRCTIQFAVDTGNLEEDEYLLEIGSLGYVVSGRCLTESKKIVDMLAQIPKEKYSSALSYEERQFMEAKNFGKNYVVLLQSIPDADIRVYGYDGEEYGPRGLMIDYKGTYSYFDKHWDPWRFAPQLYQGDYDGDSMKEFALIYPAGYGTGIFLEGLSVFKVQPDHTLLHSEMLLDISFLKSQLGPFIKYDKSNGKVKIVKNGEVKKIIDLTRSPDYEDCKENIVITYSNIIQFKVNGDQIKLLTEINGSPYATLSYIEGVEDNTIAFNVLYSADGFRFDLP